MSINANLAKRSIFVAGKNSKSKKLLQTLQISLPAQVKNKVNELCISEKQKTPTIELLLCPYGCNDKACPLGHDVLEVEIKRVAFYNIPNDEAALESILKGAVGAFYSHDPIEVIIRGVKLMLNNELWFKRGVINIYLKRLEEQLPHFKSENDLPHLSTILSKRELDVLALIVTCSTNIEIADELFISIHTVKSHVRNILKKMGANSRMEVASMMAKRRFHHNVLKPNPPNYLAFIG